ncbi:MAG: sulfatase [Betaproteobacteria bacterium]|nr:sulfatase [Betaproteobacteria bacterium]
MNKPVNFLFIITDQQRADHLGCYANPVLRTPHIDKLAREGFRAERCYVASPICQPNRASIMTGRMPSTHGVRHNGIDLDFGQTTFVEVLREAGYRTALAGKSHLQNITDVPAHWPVDTRQRLAREARTPAHGRHGQELASAWEADPDFELSLPYYGFEKVALSINHGDDQFGHYRRWLRMQRADADSLVGAANAIPTPAFELSKNRQAWRTRVPEDLYPTNWVTEQSIASMREFAASGKPFFIQCSYPDPHHPFTPPGKYWDMYSPEDMPLPNSFRAAHQNLPPHVQWLREQRDAGKAVKHSPALFACGEREAREAMALNYGTISQIDDGVGRLVGEMEKLGIADNTVVIFTSDHGEYMGDHQLMLKGPIHYQGVIRVPFIWRDPRGLGGVCSRSLIQSTDLAPTILERAGLPAFNGIQGHDLGGLIDGSKLEVRADLLIEEEGQRVYMGFSGRIRMRSFLDGRYRLSLYEGAPWGELYDLENDPDELVNHWDDPASRILRAEMTEALARRFIAQSDTSPYPESLA